MSLASSFTPNPSSKTHFKQASSQFAGTDPFSHHLATTVSRRKRAPASVPVESRSRRRRSSVDVQILGNGNNVSTRLSSEGHDMVDITLVPVTRTFDRFKNIAADNLVNDGSIQEDISISEETIRKREPPSVDVRILGDGGNVSTQMSTGCHDVVPTTTVHVSRIFDRFRNMCLNNVGSDYMSYADNWNRDGDQQIRTTTLGNAGYQNFYTPLVYIQILHSEASAINDCSTLGTEKAINISQSQSLQTKMYNQSSSSRNVPQRSQNQGDTTSYIDLGDCDQECRHCGCLFWYNERLKGNDYATSKKQSFHGPGRDEDTLNPDIVEGLIHVLDENNGLVRLFRTARERCSMGEIPGFKIRLYNKGGVRGYELPTSDILGGIVFEDGPNSRTDFDVIIEFRGGPPQRINKLHQSYMSLQFPLLFIFGEPGFYPDLVLNPRYGRGKGKKVTMNTYYKYQLHLRVKEFRLIFRGVRLFQQYVVAVFCAVEQNQLDWVRNHQNDLRFDYLLGLYDAVSRGDLLYTIEFQKRGLPHCHTLLWVDSSSKIRNAVEIDEYISAEIHDPVEDP
ncbi:DNA helicase [Tanacetum coccineum]